MKGIKMSIKSARMISHDWLGDQENSTLKGWILPIGLRHDLPIKEGFVPFKHQIEAYTLGCKLKNVAIFHEPGLGKTFTTVALMGRRYLDKQIKRVLVVAPLSVVPVWGEEIEKYAGFDVQTIALIGKKKVEKLSGFNGDCLNVAVINYESLRRIEKELTRWRPDMIILDESQRIKSHRTKQSQALHRMGVYTKFRIILSGTPIGNCPTDLWSQYKFLQPNIFEKSFYAFRNHYAIMGGFENRKVVAYKNVDSLKQKAHSIAHRATKEQALDLPDYTNQTLYCELEQKATRVYKQLKKDAIAELSNDERITAPKVVTQMLRLSQLTGGFVKADESEIYEQISSAKLNLLEEILQDYLAHKDRKVVIFARFIAEIQAIEKLVKATYGSGSVRTIYGAVKGEKRGRYVKEFQEDKGVRVFIAQTQTAGLGITLHAADTAIFYSLDYRYIDYEQARARIHRAGQKRACVAIHLVAKGTIDETVAKALKHKKDLATEIIDNWDGFVG